VNDRVTGWRVYTKIADRLREEIASGQYTEGDVLPTEAAMALRFQVARNTVRRALVVLEDDGLIRPATSAGRVVTPDGQRAGGAFAPHTRYAQIARELCDEIDRGGLEPGEELPSMQRLEARFSVSHTTVRRALTLLEHRGLITREYGRCWYVRWPRPTPHG